MTLRKQPWHCPNLIGDHLRRSVWRASSRWRSNVALLIPPTTIYYSGYAGRSNHEGAHRDFPQIWLVDCEFSGGEGERPEPICCVAKEWRSGQLIRLWHDDLQRHREAPYACDQEALFVAYFASAEMGCHLALDWTMPI